jgi:hypothetical protein
MGVFVIGAIVDDLPISPLAGEMSDRTEGGATKCNFHTAFVLNLLGQLSYSKFFHRGALWRPPLSCRTSPPQVGRSANLQVST